MSNSSTLLEDAFEDALSRAAALDRQGALPEGTGDLFPGRTPSNTELVQACVEFYRENQAVMDRAVQDVLDFLGSPHGAAYVKALEGSFESTEPNPLSVELASGMLRTGEFDLATSQPQGLRGFGVGVSAGVSAFIGLLAGADIVFDFKDEAEVHPRVWKGGSLKGGLSVSAGLELSFWVKKPVTGVIAGWLLDLYIPTKYILIWFIRFMYINQRAEGTTDLTFSGVSLQFPLGIGFPIRQSKEKDGVLAVFLADQTAWDRPRRATLQVVNQATGVSTIAVQETATVAVTLENTSGDDVDLSPGAAMTINMPSYFSAADVSAMKISYPGWTFADDGSKLTLTLVENFPWTAGADISFDITNVKSSSQPPVGQQSYPGRVTLGLNDASFTSPIAVTAEFDLVWANSEASLNWKTTLAPGFTLLGPGSGSTVAYAQPGNEIVTLTTATDSKNTVWVLGYVFNYNTAMPDQAIPQVCATWWKQDAPKVGNNVFYGNKVSPPGDTSVCYYAGLSTSGSEIAIAVTFG